MAWALIVVVVLVVWTAVALPLCVLVGRLLGFASGEFGTEEAERPPGRGDDE